MGAPKGERRSGRPCEHPTWAAQAQAETFNRRTSARIAPSVRSSARPVYPSMRLRIHHYCEAFRRAAEGIRTLDLLHGKQSVCFRFDADIPCKSGGSRVSMSCCDSPAFTGSSRGFRHPMGTQRRRRRARPRPGAEATGVPHETPARLPQRESVVSLRRRLLSWASNTLDRSPCRNARCGHRGLAAGQRLRFRSDVVESIRCRSKGFALASDSGVMQATLTEILAIWGAVTGTIGTLSVLVAVLTYRRDRPKVEVVAQ